MIRKIFVGLFYCAVIFLFAFFLLKDYLLCNYLSHYISKNFKANCKIEKVHLSSGGITIINFSFSNESAELNFKKAYIKFNLSGISHLSISGLFLEDAVCKIKNFAALMPAGTVNSSQPARTGISSSPPKEADPRGEWNGLALLAKEPQNSIRGDSTKKEKSAIIISMIPMTLDLKNVSVYMQDKRFGAADVQFSLKSYVSKERIRLEYFEIYDCNLHYPDVEIKHVTIRKMKNNLYIFNIPMLRLKQKEFNRLIFPLKLEGSRVLLPMAKNILFGPNAYMGGVVNLGYGGNLCMQTSFQRASLDSLVTIIGGEENISISGLFDGTVNFCFQEGNLKKFEGYLSNQSGGLIHIKKETSLDFLRSYLDNASYNALVDNLKNYEYNKGIMRIRQEKEAISLEMDFSSENMGKRSVTINFHNSVGGAK